MATSVFGEGSPWQRFIELDGKLLGVGISMGPVTFYHRLEDEMGDAFPLPVKQPETHHLRCRDAAGQLHEVPVRAFFVEYMQRRIDNPSRKDVRDYFWREFVHGGLMHVGDVGAARCWWIQARPFHERLRQLAAEGVPRHRRRRLHRQPRRPPARRARRTVITLDNLSHRLPRRGAHGELVVGDTGDRELVDRLLREHEIDTVMHFAAHTIVPESVATRSSTTATTPAHAQPARVLHRGRREALRVLVDRGGLRHSRPGGVAARTAPTAPINPYGTSKLMSEWMLRDLCRREPACATWRCATSTSPAATPAGASASRRRRRRC
jgi:hypothetical protein